MSAFQSELRLGAAVENGARPHSPIAATVAAIRAMGDEPSPQRMLAVAAQRLTEALRAHACLISRLDDDVLSEAAEFSYGVPISRGLAYYVSDYPATAEVLATGRPRTVSAADADADASEVFVLRELGMQSVLIVPLYTHSNAWGLVEVYDRRPRPFDEDDANIAEVIAGQVSALLSRFEHERAVDLLYHDTLASLTNALEAKDGYTSRHTHEVAKLARAVAEELEVRADELRTVELGALLHDIGKIKIPEAILNKPGPLTDEEWVVMKTHPAAGENILRPMRSLRAVLPIVRSHHERWDGGGYPDGLRGESIPIGARIVAVCDAYGAMIEPRPYRDAMTTADARAELSGGAGAQFDPSCVEAVLRVLTKKRRRRHVVALRPPTA